MNKITELKTTLQNIAKFANALAILGWDEEVNLPPKGHAYRGDIIAALSAEVHRQATSDGLYNLVEHLAQSKIFAELSHDEKVIVREAKRDIEYARKLPTEFVERLAKITSVAFETWVKARKASDFKIFEPVLAEIIELKQEEAKLLGYKKSPYDALIDGFEPGMTTEIIDGLFTPLAENLAGLIAEAGKTKPIQLGHHHYDIEKQKEFGARIAATLGYDLEAGRIDISPHPFTVDIHPTDVRITTRYNENDFWVALGSTIHEVGHALYEQGLSAEDHGTALAEAVSLGIHESQSRTWENFVGRGRPFVKFLYPKLKAEFGQLPYGEKDLFHWLNRVQPDPIRVESDEVTYNMHIVLRYELEKALIEGQMKVRDLPAAWNEKVKKYLGLEIKNDAEGVLQDVHWSHASFGYFPTYTLGNLYAAQLFATARKDLPHMEDEFAAGDFSSLLAWLRKNIHKQGRRYSATELVKKVTGEELDAKYLLDHLKTKIDLQQ